MKKDRSLFNIVMVFVGSGVVWIFGTSIAVYVIDIDRALLFVLWPLNAAVLVVLAVLLMFKLMAKAQNGRRESLEDPNRSGRQMLEVLGNVPIISIAANMDGVITLAKGGAPYFLGYKLEEIVGKFVHEVFKDNKDICSDFERALEGESFENVHSCGNHVFQCYFRPSYDEHGNVQTVNAIAVDITEKKRYERELARVKEEMDRAQRVRTEFIANISHEIRTPLNIVAGYAGILRMKYGGDAEEEDQEIYSSIDESSDRLMNTVEKLLDVSRFRSDDFRAKLVDISLTQTLNDLHDDFNRIAAKKNLELIVHPPDKDINVVADQHALRRALTEILENALKFTLEGKVEIKVDKIEDDRAVIIVEDTGIGIGPEFMPRAFDEFTQEEGGYSRPFEGTGLGLALAKNFVELCNGDIRIESEKGKGTKVIVSLPVRQETETNSDGKEDQG
ncbi:MAG: PAS domain-containing protein [Chlorobi bacterium]|nr:PAS domain-containing protein [Chlorobiota bacterium]